MLVAVALLLFAMQRWGTAQRVDWRCGVGLRATAPADAESVPLLTSPTSRAIGHFCSKHAAPWSYSIAHFMRGYADAQLTSFPFTDFLAEARALPRVKGQTTIAVVILSGVVWSTLELDAHEWSRGMLHHLAVAAREFPLPDSFFFLTCSDWTLRPRTGAPSPLMLGVTTDDTSWDIGVPGQAFPDMLALTRAPWWSVFVPQVTSSDGGLFPDVPWSSRRPLALWRGTLMCEGHQCASRCTRMQVRLAAEARPDILDVRFTDAGAHFLHCAELLAPNLTDAHAADGVGDATSLAVQAAAFIPLASLVQFKMVVGTMGHTLATGYKAFLASGAAVLRERQRYKEFFEPALVPWQHFIPFDCRDAAHDCELLQVLDSAFSSAAMDARVAAVGAAGRAFAQAHFGKSGRSCYWAMLLDRLTAEVGFEAVDAKTLKLSGLRLTRAAA